jgi:hypothetical protein
LLRFNALFEVMLYFAHFRDHVSRLLNTLRRIAAG